MFSINFSINNPFNMVDPISNVNFHWERKISKNKNLEIQIFSNDPTVIFNLKLDTTWWGKDHAGPIIEINVLGIIVILQIYDSRHWNYEIHAWEKYW